MADKKPISEMTIEERLGELGMRNGAGGNPGQLRKMAENNRRNMAASTTTAGRNANERRALLAEWAYEHVTGEHIGPTKPGSLPPPKGAGRPVLAAEKGADGTWKVPARPEPATTAAPASTIAAPVDAAAFAKRRAALNESREIINKQMAKGSRILPETRAALDENTRALAQVDADEAASKAAARAADPTERAVHLGLRVAGVGAGMYAGHKLAGAVADGAAKQAAARSAELIELGTRADGLLKAKPAGWGEARAVRTEMAATSKVARNFEVMRRPTGGAATVALTALALGEAGVSLYLAGTTNDEGLKEAGYTGASAGAGAATAVAAEHFWRRGQTAMPVAEAARVEAAGKTARQLTWRGGAPWKEGAPAIAAPDARPRFATEPTIAVERPQSYAAEAKPASAAAPRGRAAKVPAAAVPPAATAAPASPAASAAPAAAAATEAEAAAARNSLTVLEQRLGRVVKNASPALAATATGVLVAQNVEGSTVKKAAVAAGAGAGAYVATLAVQEGVKKLAQVSPVAAKVVGRMLPAALWGAAIYGAGKNIYDSYDAGGSAGDVVESAVRGLAGAPAITRDADADRASGFDKALLRWSTMRDAARASMASQNGVGGADGEARRGWSNAARIAAARARGARVLPYGGDPHAGPAAFVPGGVQ